MVTFVLTEFPQWWRISRFDNVGGLQPIFQVKTEEQAHQIAQAFAKNEASARIMRIGLYGQTSWFEVHTASEL